MTALPIVSQARRIIYVDASFNNETNESKICLYDVDSNKIDVLKTTLPSSSSFAERYAIVYACLYAKKYNLLDKKVHILNDNHSATVHTKIKELCSLLNISISWIPREINQIADNGTLNDCNVSIEDVHICDLFYELMIEKDMANNETPNNQKVNITQKIQKHTILDKSEKNILMNALRHSKVKNEPYISLGQVGTYLKNNNPAFTYSSLKNILEKYPKDFAIVNKNYVKVID